jgi:hypothetical protein
MKFRVPEDDKKKNILEVFAEYVLQYLQWFKVLAESDKLIVRSK